MIKWISKKWNQYKYRFVPWIAFNLKDRTVRFVPNKDDKVISADKINKFLLQFFSRLQTSSGNKNKNESISFTNNMNPNNTDLGSNCQNYKSLINEDIPLIVYRTNLRIMKEFCGFTIERDKTVLDGGGLGVKVSSGIIPSNTIVAMYPGTIYKQYEPLFFQSLSNPFIFRCIDGIHIDGNDKNLSKFLYRSCSQRDRVGPYQICDSSWLTPHPVNPLAVGQYVNNQSKRFPANVVYQEFDVPVDWPIQLRQFIPNVYYSSVIDDLITETRLTRVMVLVSLRTIHCGEELFSTYFTLVH